MCNKSSIEHTNKNEAAEGHPPAASASAIINRECRMSKVWPFVGGVIIGAAGVVAAALVADRLTYGEGGGADQREKPRLLALPEGKEETSGRNHSIK